MKRLICFGDSWTQGQGIEIDSVYKGIAIPDALTLSLRQSNSWPRWLSKYLDIGFINLGQAGIHNLDILYLINSYKTHFTKDDIIVVMWSFPYRHHKVSRVKLSKIFNDASKTLNEYHYYFCNGFYPSFREEPEEKDKIDQNNFIDIDSSAADILVEYEKTNNLSVWEYGSRNVYSNKTEFEIGRFHPNLLGYQIIASWLAGKISNINFHNCGISSVGRA